MNSDLTGQRFSFLTVKHRVLPNSHGHIRWECRCDCGNGSIVNGSDLKKGATKSCGCNRVMVSKNKATTHGMKGTPEYNSWCAMIQRCTNESNPNYLSYGGRGIKVCEEWAKFEAFLSDMGPSPFKGATIERLDNDGGYSKANCMWASRKEQSRNRRMVRKQMFQGALVAESELAEMSHVNPATFSNRIKRGWSVEKAMRTPAVDYRRTATQKIGMNQGNI